MRRVLNCSIAVLAMALATVASAQPAPVVVAKIGALVKSADGRVLGRVDRVVVKDGVAVSVNVIVSGRMVHIPIATISGAEGELTTSLTKAEANKLG